MDILSMRNYTSQLLGLGKSYDEFLRFILDLEEYHYPMIKELSQKTEIPYSQIRTYLLKIYRDLMDVENEDLKLPLDEVEYELSIEGLEKNVYLNLKNFPVLPRVGEHVVIRLFSEYLGNSHFYVSDIVHSMEDNKQVIFISLKKGFYNPYWRLRLAKAEETGEISIEENYKTPEYLLKKKLLKRGGDKI